MKRVVVAAGVVLGILGAAGRADAQFAVGFGGGYHYRTGFGFGGRHFGLGGFFGASYSYGFRTYTGFGGFGWSPYLPYYAAPLGYNPFGYYPFTGFSPPVLGWGVPGWAPPVVVVAAPPLVQAVARPPDPPPAPVDEKNFIAIRPGKGAPKIVAAPPPPQPLPEQPPPPPARPRVDAAGDRKADPKAEMVRQVELAKAAAEAEEYGRAAERLAAAIGAKPDEPLPYFLLAQVRFARGEYAEAVAAIRDGMKWAPDWPTAPFRPKALYGPHPERFDTHLADLRRAYADNPNDPAVGFLLGYELWFTGERDEAARLFRRVTGQVRDNGIVERFLLEVDAKVVGR